MFGTKIASIRRFIRGDSRVLLTSMDLNWAGLAIEQHQASPGERAESAIDHHLLILAQGPSPARVDRASAGGALVQQIVRPGDLCMHPQGAIPPIHPSYAPNLLFCALDPGLVERVAEDLKDQGCMGHRIKRSPAISYRPSFTDGPTRQLLSLLRQEALVGGQSGRLYFEHIAYALVARLFTLDDPLAEPSMPQSDPKGVRHVIDRIRTNPGGEHNADSLAAETGYSTSQFFRVFRKTAGCTPYQYILRMRMNRAVELMRKQSLSLLDIALECGFANEAHFSRMFRQHFGLPPGQFRREKFLRIASKREVL